MSPAGHGSPSTEMTEPAWVEILPAAVRWTLPPLPPEHDPAFWFAEMVAPRLPLPASTIAPVALMSMVAAMPLTVSAFVTLPVISASGSILKLHTAGAAQTVIVRLLPPSVGGTTIFPPSRMWSGWSSWNVPLLFPTLPEIWHSPLSTTPPRSVHPSANAGGAGRNSRNVATMTRGIDNRLMVQHLSGEPQMLCGACLNHAPPPPRHRTPLAVVTTESRAIGLRDRNSPAKLAQLR